LTDLDHVAVVTGAGSGIGKAITLALAEQGMTICLVGRNRDRLEAVGQSARKTSPCVHCVLTDLEQEGGITDLAKRLNEDFGYVDILVHSAGQFSIGPTEHAEISALDRQYRVNVRAPYHLTQLILPMLRLRRGQIVFINSSAGCIASANIGQYSASKFSLRAIADSLRQEVNPYGIRVLSVYPGRTATTMQASIHAMEGKDYQPDRLVQPEDIAAVVVCALSLPRTAEVTDVHVRPFLKPQ
jgi:NADP-dependent 3-hydroxy acid dehydrogenase YdfG